MRARKKWLRGPCGYPFKYRLNERSPLLIDEVVWDKDIVFKEYASIAAEPDKPNRDNIENLVPSCRVCNSRKGARLYGR